MRHQLNSLNQAFHQAFHPSRLALLALALCSANASAHHPMGGTTPSTFFEGLLSGFGHPIIGVDHLIFIIAAGLLALSYRSTTRYLLPVAFVVATAVGTGVHLLALSLPYSEIIIALSVLVFGLLLLNRNSLALSPALAAVLFAAAGIFHGYAYGEAVVGAEATPVLAYLVGFMFIQYAIALMAMLGAAKLFAEQRPVLRIGGGIIAATGALLLLQNLS